MYFLRTSLVPTAEVASVDLQVPSLLLTRAFRGAQSGCDLQVLTGALGFGRISIPPLSP